MTMLPMSMLNIKVFLCLGPPAIRARCGIISPIKPTTPTLDTKVAITMDDVITMDNCNVLTESPMLAASWLPRSKTSKSCL